MSGKKLSSILLALLLFTALMSGTAFAEIWVDLPGAESSYDAADAEQPVHLYFVSEQGIDYARLTLYDGQGNILTPDYAGNYLLPPGTYAFSYQDLSGVFEDLPLTWITLEPGTSEMEVALQLAPRETETEPEESPAAMPVVFSSDETEDFSALTVMDAFGEPMEPYIDPETGGYQFGRFLLPPGEYTYFFHDPAGVLEDRESVFTVDGSGMQTVRIVFSDAATGMSFSATLINPYYSDLIWADLIPAPETSPEESLERLVYELDAAAGRFNTVYYADTQPLSSPVVYDNAEAAGAALKRGLLYRQKEIPIRIQCNIKPTSEIWLQICEMIYGVAIRHSGAPTEGDYLRYEYGGVNCSGSAAAQGDKGPYYYEFRYAPLYFTTYEQEQELSGRVSAILNSLELSGKDDAQKILAVYQYLCDHVAYDDAQDTLIFTAYDALVNGRAACQGVSVAFYRLCLEMGVDARVVTSVQMGHAWNIACADGKRYYALDATWEPGTSPENYQYFLKGRGNWLLEHSLGDEFLNGSFAAYDFPEQDYDTEEEGVILNSVSLLFDGMLRIKYYFTIPESLMETPGTCVQLSREGQLIQTTPLTEGRRENGQVCFYCGVEVRDIDTPVQIRLLGGGGQYVPISSRGGTLYPNGFFFSPMEYARKMKDSASTASMRSLAQALEDYGTAALIYFNNSGGSVSSAVKAVSASDLNAWSIEIEGRRPTGVSDASISALFEADNSLRVYFRLEQGQYPEHFHFEIDGRTASLRRRSDGAMYLTVENIAADELDRVHSFSVSDGLHLYKINASVLGYAKKAIEQGKESMADLGRALYLYNRAAKNYFGS